MHKSWQFQKMAAWWDASLPVLWFSAFGCNAKITVSAEDPPWFWCTPKRNSCTHTGPNEPHWLPRVHFEPQQLRPLWKQVNTSNSKSDRPCTPTTITRQSTFTRVVMAETWHFWSGKEMQCTLCVLWEQSHDYWGALAHWKVFHASKQKKYSKHIQEVFFFKFLHIYFILIYIYYYFIDLFFSICKKNRDATNVKVQKEDK